MNRPHVKLSADHCLLLCRLDWATAQLEALIEDSAKIGPGEGLFTSHSAVLELERKSPMSAWPKQ